eukprot:scaffold3.g6717.t1
MAVESLDLLEQPAEGAGAAGVLGRLRAREAQRVHEAARRAEELQVSADPRESVEGFLAEFSRQRASLAAAFDAAAAAAAQQQLPSPVQLADAKALLDKLAADLAQLDKASPALQAGRLRPAARCGRRRLCARARPRSPMHHSSQKPTSSLADGTRTPCWVQAVAEAAYFLPQYDLRQCTLAVGALREQHEAAAAALQPRKRFAFGRKASRPAVAGGTAPAPPPTQQQQQEQQQEAAAVPAADGQAGGAAAASVADSGAGDAGSGTAIRGLVGQTVVHRCSSDGTEDCTLSDMRDCTVFLIGSIAALFAHRLHGCRLYTGPVAGATFVEDAVGCTLMLASLQVRIHAANGCDLYLRLRSHPIIEHSSGLRFAPYAFSYPGSEEDLAAQGLETDSGRWAEVHDFGWLRATPSPNWNILPEGERAAPPAVPAQGAGGAAASSGGTAEGGDRAG